MHVGKFLLFTTTILEYYVIPFLENTERHTSSKFIPQAHYIVYACIQNGLKHLSGYVFLYFIHIKKTPATENVLFVKCIYVYDHRYAMSVNFLNTPIVGFKPL